MVGSFNISVLERDESLWAPAENTDEQNFAAVFLFSFLDKDKDKDKDKIQIKRFA